MNRYSAFRLIGSIRKARSCFWTGSKTTMQLDRLRRTRPERVRQELWTGLLAYNLIRQSLLQSALAQWHSL